MTNFKADDSLMAVDLKLHIELLQDALQRARLQASDYKQEIQVLRLREAAHWRSQVDSRFHRAMQEEEEMLRKEDTVRINPEDDQC